MRISSLSLLLAVYLGVLFLAQVHAQPADFPLPPEFGLFPVSASSPGNRDATGFDRISDYSLRQDSPPDRIGPGRMLARFGGGLVGGASGTLLGGVIGKALCDEDEHEDEFLPCLGPAFIGAVGGSEPPRV